MAIHDSIYTFPKQQIPESQKTPSWYKKNLEAGLELLDYSSDSGIRESRRNKLVNYQLANNILSKEEMDKVINPWKLQGFEFPDELQNYPLINPKVDLLVGESYKRLFKPTVVAVNHDAITDKETKYKQTIMQFMSDAIIGDSFDEQQAEIRLQQLAKWNNWGYQDIRERMASQIIEYHSRQQNWNYTFMQGMEDLLISGEEIYRVDIVAGEPILEKANPLDVVTLRMGTSHKIADADVIIHYRRLPLGKVQDEFYEYLTSQQSAKLEAYNKAQSGGKSLYIRPQEQAPTWHVQDFADKKDIEKILTATTSELGAFGGAYDSEGNLKVVTVYWKGKRKLGIKTFFNELGEVIKIPVTEHYTPDIGNGETVKWYWVSEWYEATLLGEDTYVKMQPFVVNRYGIDNFVLKTSPMVGGVANINSSKAMSIYDRGKPYQYLYNAFMHNIRKAFRNSRGKVPILDSAWIPEGWSPEQVMFYLEEMNVMWVDSFKSGNEGAAKGKLAGNLSGQQRELNLEMGNIIQQQLLMLNFLKVMIGEITGVSDQRVGQIQSNELVGNVERAVIQSSHITEKWFALHDNIKVEALTMFLEVAKEAYRGKKEKRAYVLDDMTGAILDIDGDLLCEADYGIFVESSLDAQQLMNNLQSIAQAAMQNDKLSLSQAMDLFRIKSPSQLAKKFEQLEQEAIQRNQELMQQQMEAAQAEAAAARELELEKLRIEEDKNIRDDETKRYIAELNADKALNGDVDNDGAADDIEIAKLEATKQKNDKDAELKDKQLSETIRHNKSTESISKMKKPTSQK